MCISRSYTIFRWYAGLSFKIFESLDEGIFWVNIIYQQIRIKSSIGIQILLDLDPELFLKWLIKFVFRLHRFDFKHTDMIWHIWIRNGILFIFTKIVLRTCDHRATNITACGQRHRSRSLFVHKNATSYRPTTYNFKLSGHISFIKILERQTQWSSIAFCQRSQCHSFACWVPREQLRDETSLFVLIKWNNTH